MGARIWGLIIALVLCAGMWGCALLQPRAGAQMRVFVSNYRDDTISVVGGDPDHEIKTIKVGGAPFGLAVRTQRPLLAVANSTGLAVTLIDPIRCEVRRKVEMADIPEHVAFSVDGQRLFVTLPKAKRVIAIDPDGGQIVGEPFEIGAKPKRLAVSPDGRRLYVLLHAMEGGVAVIDLAQRKIETVVPTGRFPTDFGITRDGRRIVAVNFDDDTASVIDTEALRVVATQRVVAGLGMLVHPTDPIVYSMASFDDAVDIVNYETGERIGTLELGVWPTYSAITPDGRFLYVAHEDSNNLVKVDTKTKQQLGRIAVGLEPANVVVFQPE